MLHVPISDVNVGFLLVASMVVTKGQPAQIDN